MKATAHSDDFTRTTRKPNNISGGKRLDNGSRRKKIKEIIGRRTEPISGSELARGLNVSRQVIVQDIAFLRASGESILSTGRGYLPGGITQDGFSRVIFVQHSADEIRDELYTIVDFGGRIQDVFVIHPVYGKISAELSVRNRNDADRFLEDIHNNKTKPLLELTGAVHAHTITAESEESLDAIAEALKKKGYMSE